MMAALKQLVPGTEHWPRFVRNRGEQFEGRFSLVELQPSPSIFFAGMDGSMLPIAVAHGEGRAEFATDETAAAFSKSGLVSARYVEGNRKVATNYPANPNGSPFGIAAITNEDGRVTLTMPHPERSFRSAQNSWRPDGAAKRPSRRRRARLAATRVQKAARDSLVPGRFSSRRAGAPTQTLLRLGCPYSPPGRSCVSICRSRGDFEHAFFMRALRPAAPSRALVRDSSASVCARS
jgi:hypothetical protein